MSAALDAEAENAVIRPVWLLWLDVEGDPLYAHTGYGTISFGESETDDDALNGKTFLGLGTFAAMGAFDESDSGSGPVRLTIPGVDPSLAGFAPLVSEARRWQWRRAVLWFSYVAEDGSGLIDYPEREKTGRMDGLLVQMDGETCTITIDLEGYAASSGPPLGSQYADQQEIDPTDISQTFVGDLINRQPDIGVSGNAGGADGVLVTPRVLRPPHVF